MGTSRLSPAGLDLPNLEREASRLIKQGIAPATAHTYRAGTTAYTNFCNRFNFALLPASEDQLILFVADLAQTKAYSTIKVYLAAVRHLHIIHNFGNPLEGKLKLDLTLKGTRRDKPRAVNSRLPITPLILRRVKNVLDGEESYSSITLWAVMCTAFFGFMRSGEFTVKSKSEYNPAKRLSLSDVAMDNHEAPTLIKLTLRYSKTDQFGLGADIFLSRNDTPICPVQAMVKYLKARGSSEGVLFIDERKSPLTKQRLSQDLNCTLMKAKIDPSHYKTHSFRIGAATTAAACGIPDSTIKMLGRWSSNAFQVYLQTPAEKLVEIAAAMGKSLL